MTPDARRLMSMHEAGHAVVALYLGIDLIELRISETDGGTCTRVVPDDPPRSWHSLPSLGGYFAAAMHCQDCSEYSDWNSWVNCIDDLNKFHSKRMGMTYRTARRFVIGILKEDQEKLFFLADLLARDGFVNSTNCGEYASDS